MSRENGGLRTRSTTHNGKIPANSGRSSARADPRHGLVGDRLRHGVPPLEFDVVHGAAPGAKLGHDLPAGVLDGEHAVEGSVRHEIRRCAVWLAYHVIARRKR